MKTVYAILIAALLATAAEATYYVDERFETSVPPPGWTTHNENGGYWTQELGGPWTKYAVGRAPTNGTLAVVAAMESPPFNVAAGKTLYYRFQYQYHVGTFTDNFQGEDVHIYKFTKPPRYGEAP